MNWEEILKKKKKVGDKRFGRKNTKLDRRLYNKRKAKKEIEEELQ
tara:strand:- start:6381 stop:6515 length:135 start_codon:yes stop_codon:yes gene_type:complete